LKVAYLVSDGLIMDHNKNIDITFIVHDPFRE